MYLGEPPFDPHGLARPRATRSTTLTPCSQLSATGPGTAAGHWSRPAPETDGPRITALARHDPDTGTVTLVLDATANAVMFAIAAHAHEREAHIREVEQFGQSLPAPTAAATARPSPPARPG
jgi:hypothetical protein